LVKNIDTYYYPLDLLNIVEKENELVPKDIFFNNPKYQKAMETWCAAVFGIGYSEYLKTCKVKINKANSSPDFFLKVGNQVFEFEITEVQEEGRKRGDYYKKLKRNPNMLTPYRPEKGRQKAPEWIYEGIKKKARHYGDCRGLNLLVYANFSVTTLERNKILNAVKEFKETFSSVWVIINSHICSLFSNKALGEIMCWCVIHRN
jgi:hypothetical protein